MDTHRPKSSKMRLNGQPVAVRLGHSEWYMDGHPGQEVIAWSWSGQFFTTSPLEVDHRASPVGVGPVMGGWNDSTPAHLEMVLDSLITVVDTWKHQGHPRHRQQGRGPTLPLWQSLLASWVVRGCRTRTLTTKGALALHLPGLVADAEDPEVDVTVGLSGVEGWGDVIIGAEETTGANFNGFDFKRTVKRRVGTLWGLSPELKLFLGHHILP